MCQTSSSNDSKQHRLLLLLQLLLHAHIACSSLQPSGAEAAPSAPMASVAAGTEQSAVPACTSTPKALTIPRIIHRNFMEGRVAMYAATQLDAQQLMTRAPHLPAYKPTHIKAPRPNWQLHWLLSCKAHHPTWAEMIWNEADILALITEEYPWFLQTYLTYKINVFRSDLARMVILHKHGGVYLDADVECYKDMEPSLAGLDLILNCRTRDVAHNAAMASIAGHPVWIETMKEAMAFVQRLHPVISTDPLTATGPVLVSQTVQRFYGLTKGNFCDQTHTKNGMVFKAYPRGQWFTPCWPWFNVRCYKQLESEGKFRIRNDPQQAHIVGVHHYSGTWTSQARSSQDRQRRNDRLLTSQAVVRFFWSSPHFVEYNFTSALATLKTTRSGSSISNLEGEGGSSGSLVLRHKDQHKRPTHNANGVVRRILQLQTFTAAEAASTKAPEAATAAAGNLLDQAAKAGVGEPLNVSRSGMFSSQAVWQLATLRPCLVLSILQHPSQNSSAVAAAAQAEPPTASGSSNNSGSTYWSNVDAMLSTWKHDLGCQVTVASSAASLASEVAQLAPVVTAFPINTASTTDTTQRKPQRTQQSPRGAPAAMFVKVDVEHLERDHSNFTSASLGQEASVDGVTPASRQVELIVQLIQQQREQQRQEMGCEQITSTVDVTSGWFSLPQEPPLSCKAPLRHAMLHLSCSTDVLLSLAEQLYDQNAQVSHSMLERHARFSGGIHWDNEQSTVVDNNRSHITTSAVQSNIVSTLDSVDLFVVDVQRPDRATSSPQGWSKLYNVLYQLHGFVGFLREPLPGGMTRLGWIRRPDRLTYIACAAQNMSVT